MGMGRDEGKVSHILPAFEAFDGLAFGIKAAERNGFHLIVLIQFPLTGGLGGDDQVLIVILGGTGLYKEYEQQSDKK